MSSIENNSDDWREIRARVDSIANAIFLIAGGALSLSISVILGNKDAGFITSQVARLATAAWYSLVASVFLFLLLKVHLVSQAYLLQFNAAFVNKHLTGLNRTGWVIGVLGLITFIAGLILMVRAAAIAVSAP